ncbi:MAG: nitroreductase family protein [Candidatus Dadabacteria bacterium]
MELLEAIGTRRSIRFYKPWQDVEDWKIQRILQAARYASCQGNCGSTEAIVIDKRTYPKEKFEQIIECASPFNEQPLRQAPIVIAWLVNMDAWYKELVESFSVLFPARAVTAAYGWTYKILTESTYPRLMSFPKDRAEDLLRIEAGQAIANALLAATEVGLGACLSQQEESRRNFRKF